MLPANVRLIGERYVVLVLSQDAICVRSGWLAQPFRVYRHPGPGEEAHLSAGRITGPAGQWWEVRLVRVDGRFGGRGGPDGDRLVAAPGGGPGGLPQAPAGAASGGVGAGRSSRITPSCWPLAGCSRRTTSPTGTASIGAEAVTSAPGGPMAEGPLRHVRAWQPAVVQLGA